MDEYIPIPPDPITNIAVERFDINYLFPYQRLVISNILEAGEYYGESHNTEAESQSPDVESSDETDPPAKQIVILPTGAGKSLCFMLPSIMLTGPTLVIFPLLSLISDQLRRCADAGIASASLTGGQNARERSRIFTEITAGKIKIVLTNPETALSPKVLPKIKECRFMHLVFDEVHTVSEWGDTFRPAYLECRRIFLEANIPIVTAFTATASDTVLKRIKEVLFPGESPHEVAANPDRPNISYTVLPSLCKINSLQLLLGGEKTQNGYSDTPEVLRPALVFCSTRKTAERTALQLRMRLNDNEVFFYHAGLSKEEKAKIENWFFASDNGVLCATTAYGMGIDKSGIRTVIHHDLSPSVEAYLQESGRAGRDRTAAEAILLLSPSDTSPNRQRRGTPASAARHDALLRFAADNKTCRRESLMRLLGAEPDTCFGCDVCRNTVTRTSPWEEKVLKLLRRNRRVLSPAAAASMLHRVYPLLPEDDAPEIINSLLISGAVRRIRRGPWKGKLTIIRKMSYL